jgi:hypothetical protein
MRITQRQFKLLQNVRRSSVVLIAVALGLLTAGMPLPEAPPKKSGDPFPCQHHRCGCVDADQCWRSCCCMTRDQKLSWARRHGVTPPAFVQNSAEESFAAASPPSCGACCQHHRVAGNDTQAEQSRAVSAPDEGFSWTWSIHATKCRGLSTYWVAIGYWLVPPRVLTDEIVKLEPVCCAGHLMPESFVTSPDVPPPRTICSSC